MMTSGPTNASQPVALQARGLTRHFGGVAALQDVDLCLRGGEIHALMGQNGAGKSTLIRMLTGALAADAGTLELDGRAIAPATPVEAQRLGISTVYQEVNLCPNLSVAENLLAGRYPRHRRWRTIDWPRVRREAETMMAGLGLELDVRRPLSRYPVAIQQMVAIARSLGLSACVLILDEPTSSLDESEVEALFTVMRGLRERGLAILFVTHFLDQVYAVSDRITVLRNGRRVGERVAADWPHAALVASMIGRELQPQFAHTAANAAGSAGSAGGPMVASARGLGRRGGVEPVDLDIRRGEVVGLGGLLGSGRTELARLMFGLDRSDRGEWRVGTQPSAPRNPAEAVAMGLAMCPEERKTEGIVADLSVRENIVLSLQARRGWRRYLKLAQQTKIAAEFVALLDIGTAGLETPVGQLSGGNQQKVVLARWLATQPSLLILDEPTRGIDVAAKQEIMARIAALARDGMAVLFISAEIEELVRVADRIAVMRDRRKVGELAQPCDTHAVLAMIAGS